MNIDYIIFFFLAFLSIASAIMVITKENPISSAMFLVFNFFILAGLYLTLSAQFIAIIQILVYAGAIMVLFIFIIMLLNLDNESKLKDSVDRGKIVKTFLAFVMIALIIYIILFSGAGTVITNSGQAAKIGTVEQIGFQLFTNYLLPFEVTSLLLLAAIIGAVVLAKKRFP
jgi:NADH-quinone oxidoreductase subunit J